MEKNENCKGTLGGKLIFEHGGLLVYDLKGSRHFADNYLPEYSKYSAKKSKTISNPGVIGSSVPDFIPEYFFEVPKDNTSLTFNSKFESGNLSKVCKMSDYEYKLFISNDIGNPNYNHWFYFSVFNPRRSEVKFTIVNMHKKDVLYMAGMKPAIYSTKLDEKFGKKWHRGGKKIKYSENSQKVSMTKSYTLSFTYDFQIENDTVFFAYSIPYTYTDLYTYLNALETNFPNILRIDTLCSTNAGNSCPVLTITNSIQSYIPSSLESKLVKISSNTRKTLKIRRLTSKYAKSSPSNEDFFDKKHLYKFGMILMARVHSGEAVSSYMIKGAIDFLLSEAPEAKVLRNKSVFKIIPMLNPDGVRYGNYRSCLNGFDLNRTWKKPDKALQPTIFYTKRLIEVFKEFHSIKLICDMHGHTKKFNAFMYGCCSKSHEMAKNNLLAKVVPLCLGQRNKKFSYKDSRFCIEKDRRGTARIVFFKDFAISHSYTLEASFYKAEGQNDHFDEKDLEEIGRDLVKTCRLFTRQSVYLNKVQETNNYLRKIQSFSMASQCRNKSISIKEISFQLEENKNLDCLEFDIEPFSTTEGDDFEATLTEENEKPLEKEFWQNLEIIDICPDDPSSGSDSEVLFESSPVSLKLQSKKKPIQSFPVKVTPSPKPIPRRPLRSISICRPRTTPRENLKSLNPHNYNFGEQILENHLIQKSITFRSKTLIQKSTRIEKVLPKKNPVKIAIFNTTKANKLFLSKISKLLTGQFTTSRLN